MTMPCSPRLAAAAIAAAIGLAAPARAAPPAAPPPAQTPAPAPAPRPPVTDRSVDAADVVATPVTDLNLKKGEIPPLLLAAQDAPYWLGGGTRCSQLATAIGELDAVLGPDLDLPQPGGDKVDAGRVAQAAVRSIIPFSGLIREVSGANEQERRLRSAIMAGEARRAFLKGYGQARGCRYPARAAPPSLVARQAAPAPHAPAAKEGDPRFVSQPVVQKPD